MSISFQEFLPVSCQHRLSERRKSNSNMNVSLQGLINMCMLSLVSFSLANVPKKEELSMAQFTKYHVMFSHESWKVHSQ